MNKNVVTAIFFFLLLSACTEQNPKAITAPLSDLGHIDVILDSTTWHAIKNDTFIKREFTVLEVDTTTIGGKDSYDLYLLGHLNFLHLSLAKAFWENQRGGGVLVFQTQKPGQKESLLQSWKPFYKDSLLIHSFKGSDFTLDEVMAWYERDTTKPKEPNIFANLTSYSVDAYKNWGITDSIVSAGLAMKQFMEDWGGKPLKNRLFHSITELHMTINQKEFKEIRSALLAVGYQEKENSFTHASNPAVHVMINEEYIKSKYSKVKFKLNRPMMEKEIYFSPMVTLKLNGEEGWLLLN